jgi:hypothetical protein
MNKTVKIGANTFLGTPDHPDVKPTYCIVTEQGYYIGPTLGECKRMLQEKGDETSIEQYGRMSENAVAFMGLWMDACGLNFVFG